MQIQISDQYDLAISTSADVKDALEKQGSDLRGSLNHLSDTDFALVLAGVDQEGVQWKVRKFACVDERNTAEAVYAFLRFPQQFPNEDSEKLAAQNLLRNVYDFGLTPPPELIIKAGSENPAPATNYVLVPKEAIVTMGTKVASSITESPAIKTEADYYDALAYWGDNDYALTGWEKRALAKDIVAAGEGMTIPSQIEKYAADTYAADLAEQIVVRQQKCLAKDFSDEEFAKNASLVQEYKDLFYSVAHLTPDDFASRLDGIDKKAGLVGKVPDAVFSTYGKRAKEEKPIFTYGPHTVYETGLDFLAKRHMALLNEQFGYGFADEFQKNPVAIFQSLPHPQKIIMARLVSQKIGDDGVPT